MNDELYHYGVPGMKWGVRRSQNKLDRIDKRSKKNDWSEDATTAAKIKTKKVSQMTNAELRKLNDRRNLEQQNANLSRNSNKGRAAVKAFIATAGTITAVSAAAAIYAKHGKKAYQASGKIKEFLKVAINAKKSGIADKTIAKAAMEALKMRYLK